MRLTYLWISVACALRLHTPTTPNRRAASPIALAAADDSSNNGKTPIDALRSALPFIDDERLLAENVRYTGLGLTLPDRAAYADAASKWRATLPTRLRNFEITDVVVLPPDGRGVCSLRYKLSFDAPVPPAVLPGQRRRLAAANLQVSPDGRTRVTAVVVGSLTLDASRTRVVRHVESLAADPFAVLTSIAHFELLNARALAMMMTSSSSTATAAADDETTSDPGKASMPSVVAEPLAYWSALRGMMRLELEEATRRAQTDEMSVLSGGAGDDGEVSDEQFESQFRLYIARIFLLGAAGPAVAFGVAKLIRAAISQQAPPPGMF